MSTLSVFPDIESALMFALVPMHPDVRFVTVMPAGDLVQLTARIRRGGGADDGIWVDRPTVDIDVWGFSNHAMDASVAAREIQASLLGLMGKVVQNGVIQHVATVTGPMQIPEANQALVRYNSSYEVRIHPKG